MASGFAQIGTRVALEAGDDDVALATAEWERRRDETVRQLDGLPVVSPHGAWAVLLDAQALGVDPAELSRRLLEHKVAATPMGGWGGEVAARHLRLVFSNERLALLGERGARRSHGLNLVSLLTLWGNCYRQPRGEFLRVNACQAACCWYVPDGRRGSVAGARLRGCRHERAQRPGVARATARLGGARRRGARSWAMPAKSVSMRCSIDEEIEVYVVCWTAGHDTGFHDHDESAAAITVLARMVAESA